MERFRPHSSSLLQENATMKQSARFCFFALSIIFFQPFSTFAQWFSQATDAGDPVEDNLPNPGASWNDLNGDTYPDLLITGFDPAQNNRIYLNNQNGSYTVVEETPFTQTPGIWGSVVGLLGDYDNDGDEDVMLCSYRDINFQPLPLYLLINQGAPDYGLQPDTTFTTPLGSYDSGSWVDYDLDGDLDFHTGAANNSSDRFYRNDGGTFTPLDTLSFLQFRSGFITAVSWIDIDEDGDLDLYVANYSAPNANTFHKSMLTETGDPNYFVSLAIPGLTGESGANIGFNWIDFDNDWDLDLYLNHFNAADRMFRNDGGLSFTEITGEPMLNVVDYTNFNVWADFDNDGDLDLALAHQESSSKGRVYRNDSGNFTQLTNEEAGDFASVNIAQAQSAGAADHDLDGDVDLFVVNTTNASIGAPNFLFRNEIGNQNNWIKIKLNGQASNRNGYGARVYVTTMIDGDTVRQMRYVSGGTASHAFQDNIVPHFGLSDANEVLSVKVVWPSGIVDICTGLAVNQLFELNEGACILSSTEAKPSHKADLQTLQLYPSPGDDRLTCSFTLQKESSLHWRFINTDGKIVLSSKAFSFQPGQHQIFIQTESLAKGYYYIEFSTESEKETRKWLKVNGY